MKTTTVLFTLAGIGLPAMCMGADEVRPGVGVPPDAGARRDHGRGMLQAWTQADTNADGVVSRDEFVAMKRVAALPEDKREGLFKRLDKDANGSLSRQELGWLLHPKGTLSQIIPRLPELDANKDGKISYEEFATGEVFKKLPAERQQALFRRLDENKDGVISPQDRPVSGHQGQGPQRDPREQRAASFKSLDGNADGTLDVSEFLQAPWLHRLDDAARKARFEAHDKNHDQKLDLGEFSSPELKGEGRSPGPPPATP